MNWTSIVLEIATSVVMVAGCGFLYWFVKPFLDATAKNAAMKNDVEALTTIVESIKRDIHLVADKQRLMFSHQIQKEFDTYVSLSGQINNIVAASLNLRPTFEMIDPNELEIDRKKRKYSLWVDAWNTIAPYYNSSKPFYSESIYDEIDAMLKTCRLEAELFRQDLTDQHQSEESHKKIMLGLDKITTMIRDRITVVTSNT